MGEGGVENSRVGTRSADAAAASTQADRMS